MTYIFDSELFSTCIMIFISGTAIGFTVGFISWAIGYAIYGIIKWFKMA